MGLGEQAREGKHANASNVTVRIAVAVGAEARRSGTSAATGFDRETHIFERLAEHEGEHDDQYQKEDAAEDRRPDEVR